MDKTIKVVVGIGSNTPQRKENVAIAIRWLQTVLFDFRCSHIYETPPHNATGPGYTNCVGVGFTSESADELQHRLKCYEQQRGRTPEARLRNEVAIDIDILIYGNTPLRPDELNRSYITIGLNAITHNQS